MNEQKIFFSYARADASAFTLQLANDLRNAGANVWIDQLDIRGGEKYNVAIEQALASSTHLLFVVTQKSIASEYVLDEVYYALDEKKVVIPVITHEAKLPFRLRGLQQISFVDNYENGLHKLLRSLHLTPVRPEEARDPNTPAPVSSAPVRQEAVTETTPPQAAEEDLLWKRALSHPTVTAYRAYLEKYPKGKYRQKALAALHQEEKKTKQGPEDLPEEKKQPDTTGTTAAQEKEDSAGIDPQNKGESSQFQEEGLPASTNKYLPVLKITVPILLAIGLILVLFRPFSGSHTGVAHQDSLSTPPVTGPFGKTMDEKKLATALLRYDDLPTYSTSLSSFRDGRLAVASNNKVGFVDSTGTEVVKLLYDAAVPFSEGMAVVEVGLKYGFINAAGTEVITPKYDKAFSFKGGLAYVEEGEKRMFINKRGEAVIPLQTGDHVSMEGAFHEGLIGVQRNGSWGFMDKAGNLAVPPRYEAVKYFSEDLAAAMKNDKWGYIDKNGNEVLGFSYQHAGAFIHGLALVETGSSPALIDKNGNVVLSIAYPLSQSFDGRFVLAGKATGEYGYFDRTGKEIIPPKYTTAYPFQDGVAIVGVDDGSSGKDSKFGCFDTTGKEILPPQYEAVQTLGHGLIFTRLKKKKYIFNTRGVLLAESKE